MKDGKLFYNGWSGLTYTDVSSFINKEISVNDGAVVNNLIKSLEEYICHQCNRNFLVLNNDYYEEKFTAGKMVYRLKSYPVDIKKIILDDIVLYDKEQSENKLKLNYDFFIKNNLLVFTEPLLSDNYNSLIIQYNITKFWGEDIKQLIIRIVADIYLNRSYSGKTLSSFNFGGVSLNFVQNENKDLLAEIIRYYKKISL